MQSYIEEREDKPHSDFITHDAKGVPMYKYVLQYKLGDSYWNTDIWAYDFEDAELRCNAMRCTLEVSGQLYERVDV